MEEPRVEKDLRDRLFVLRRKDRSDVQLPTDLFVGADGLVYRGRRAVLDANREYERNLGVPGTFADYSS